MYLLTRVIRRQVLLEESSIALQELGPTFIKFGQMLSTRGDLLPESCLVELRMLTEDVLDRAMSAGLLPRRPDGVTLRLPLLGAAAGRPLSEPPGEHLYGSEAPLLRGQAIFNLFF